MALSHRNKWTLDLGHHDKMATRLTLKTKSCGRLRAGHRVSQESEVQTTHRKGRRGQTITTWALGDDDDEISSAGAKTTEGGAGRGVITHPSRKGQLRAMWVRRWENLMLVACSQPWGTGESEGQQRQLRGPAAWSLFPAGVSGGSLLLTLARWTRSP